MAVVEVLFLFWLVYDRVPYDLKYLQFFYKTNCGNLVLKPTMNLKDFNEKYSLLDEIVEQHKKKFKPNQKIQAPLMPFFCFKLPNNINNPPSNRAYSNSS